MTKASDNLFPGVIIRESANDGSDFSNPTADYRRLFLGEDGALHLKDSAGAVTDIGGGGNYTGVPWSSGTSMPGGPSTNDRVTRTDLGLDFFYDGTRWLTTQLFSTARTGNDTVGLMPYTTTGVRGYTEMWAGDFDIWVETWYASTNTAATNDGTHYWTLTLERPDATTLGSFTTAADTAGTLTNHKTTINALLGTAFTTKSSHIQHLHAKTSTPGGIYMIDHVTYRLVGT